jgi:valyl-tRNA synthetase
MEKQYNHQESEQLAQRTWEQEQTYKAANNPGPLYSIDTPPPTVSGSLHIGHIFSYTQTDIIARYKRMNGFSVFYPFGFDDNGLPTERYVEQKLNIQSHSMSRSEFIKLCLQETKGIEEQFKHLWQRMGLSVDWDLCYSTISDQARKLSQESFIALYNKGFIYRTYEPALYCTNCRTSVAQAELDDAQKPSFFNDIVFQDFKGNDLIIGTTRPELLPACVALLYNPADERYTYLKGSQATVPLYGFKVPVLEDESVSIEKGTGLVMCCTFGDKTDILWYKKFKLPYKQVIGLDGKWVESTGPLAGLRTQNAREKVLEELRAQNLLLRQQAITHNVNVHERCKKEIEYIALSQWFLNILNHKQALIEQADSIAWHPAFMKTRYVNWVENVSWDWCLSRQRSFGIPFPVWHCLDCKTILLAQQDQLPVDPQETPYKGTCTNCSSTNIVADTDVMDTWNTSSLTPYLCYLYYQQSLPLDMVRQAHHERLLESPTPPPLALTLREASGVNARLPAGALAQAGSKGADGDNPFTSNTPPDFIPMSMRPQAHDIIRTWAFYTIIKSWMHHGTVPWNDIVISGHVLSDAKEKLSKSKGNNKLAPETLLEQYPADVIRYWTASGSLGHDVAFSENQLKIGQRLVTKLWNAFRFVAEHGAAQDINLETSSLGTINEWLLNNASECFDSYKNYFEQHEFGIALTQIERFFWNDFCDNYLELVKDQLFNPANYDAQAVAATRWTLYHVGLRILQMYAPYLPHITETLYKEMYQKNVGTPSLHQTRFAQIQTPYVFTASAEQLTLLIGYISQVRALKSKQQLSLKVPLATLTICMPEGVTIEHLKAHEQLLKGITHATTVIYKPQAEFDTSMRQEGEDWHATVSL